MENVVGSLRKGVSTRGQLANYCEHHAFVSCVEPQKVYEALEDSDWLNAMHEQLNNFEYNKVWRLVPRLSVFWERGSPDLPAYGLPRGSKGGPAWPIFINTSSRPSRGAKPRGADDKELPQARPRQAGSRGGGEFKAGYLARCP